MFDATKYKSYRYHSIMVYIDPKTTITDVKNGCPLFIANARTGEKRTMYRGHIIVQKSEQFSSGKQLIISVYAYDVRKCDTYCISTKAENLQEAKRLIDMKMDMPELEPLTLSYREVTLTIPVQVRATVFHDKEGKAVQIEVDEYLKIGKEEQFKGLNKTDPGDRFTSEVSSEAGRALR